MSKGMWEKLVLCPFYVTDDRNSITCEGVCPASDRITQFFGSREAKNFQRKEYCDRCFVKCELYNVINEKYDK